MDEGTVYVCDADALINLNRHYPTETRKLRQVVSEGSLKIPKGVYRELVRGTDRLRDNVEKWEGKYKLVIYVEQNQELQSELGRIESAYGEKIKVGCKIYDGFWKSPAGKHAADGQVVAVGKVYGYTVVSDDKAVRLACMLENVQCIGWTEFARQIRIMQPATGTLPFEDN